MNFIKAFNALNVIVQTPAIRLWLLANDPKALKQAEDALRPVSSTDDVTVATSILAERLDNIAANFGMVPGMHVTSEICNGRGHVTCHMRFMDEAYAFRDFAKLFLHRSAAVEESGPANDLKVRVVFLLDEDNI